MSTELIYQPGQALRVSERIFARVWKLIALRGVVAITFAVVLLIWPHIGLTAMVGAVGVFAIVSGSVSSAAAFALPAAAKRHRSWLTAHAVVGVLGGTVVMLWPDLSATALLYAVAVWAVAAGAIELVAAVTLPLSGPRTALVAVGGIALAACGVTMFVEPGTGTIAVLALVAGFALVRGTSDVALAVQLRHVSGDLDRSFQTLTGMTRVAHG